MKIVINRCYGGFDVSKKAREELGWTKEWFNDHDLDDYDVRTDPNLIALIEKKGRKYVGTDLSFLTVVEIPDDVDWYIDNYDGMETIEEVHRSWC